LCGFSPPQNAAARNVMRNTLDVEENILYNLLLERTMERPITTLFMLMSVDGKISTGFIDERDADKDFPKIDGIKNG
jgi:hypothetical protein